MCLRSEPKMKKTATILDVAQAAGVSKSTVSRVVTQSGPVDDETRRRVLEAMHRLRYTPDFFAQAMKSRRSHALGLVIPDFSNPFYAEVFKGVEGVARQRGYLCTVCVTGTNPKDEMRCIQDLVRRKIEGLIYFTYDQNETTIEYLTQLSAQMPVVFMDPVAGHRPITHVMADGLAGTREATEYLLGLGRKRIGYIKGPACHYVTQDRFAGYRRALQAASLELNPTLLYEGDFQMQSGFAGAAALMSQKKKPDAIMAATDVMAIGALKYLAYAGVAVPEQVAVVGFDNIALAKIVEPSLTTVAQPILGMGRRAAELIMAAAGQGFRKPQKIVMDCALIVRRSTDKAQPRAVTF